MSTQSVLQPGRNQPIEIPRLAPIALQPLEDEPLVSVLIGNYNYERYLPDCLDSMLGQTYAKWEAIVCDDGSSDRSRDVIESFAARDARIKPVYQKNGGHGAALSTAFRRSRGSVIALLDADDTFVPEKLASTVTALQEYPRAGIVIHKMRRMDADGYASGEPMPDRLVSGWLGERALAQGGNVSGVPPTSGLVFRREVAERVFPLPPVFRRAADAYLFRLAQFITEVARIDKPLSLYRVHGANVTASGVNAATMAKLVEDYHRVFHAQQEFLARSYAPAIAGRLVLERAPGYCDFVLCYALMSHGELPPETRFRDVKQVLECVVPSFRRKLWSLMTALPASLAAKMVPYLLGVWWGGSPVNRSLRALVRSVR